MPVQAQFDSVSLDGQLRPVQHGRRLPTMSLAREGFHAAAAVAEVRTRIQPVSHVQLLQVHVRVVLVRRVQAHPSRETRPRQLRTTGERIQGEARINGNHYQTPARR